MRILPIAFAVALLGVAGTASAVTATDNLDINMELVNECFLTVQDYTGQLSGMSAQSSVAGNAIVVQCNADTPYTVEIAQGQNAAASPVVGLRALTNGIGDYIAYEIYSDNGWTTPWTTAGNAVSGIGTGMGVQHTYYLTFFDAYLAPGGIYTDSPEVTLTYN